VFFFSWWRIINFKNLNDNTIKTSKESFIIWREGTITNITLIFYSNRFFTNDKRLFACFNDNTIKIFEINYPPPGEEKHSLPIQQQQPQSQQSQQQQQEEPLLIGDKSDEDECESDKVDIEINEDFHNALYQKLDDITKEYKTLMAENAILVNKVTEAQLMEKNVTLDLRRQILETEKYKQLAANFQKQILTEKSEKRKLTSENEKNRILANQMIQEKSKLENQYKIMAGLTVPGTLEEVNELELKLRSTLQKLEQKKNELLKEQKDQKLCLICIEKRKMCGFYSLWACLYLRWMFFTTQSVSNVSTTNSK